MTRRQQVKALAALALGGALMWRAAAIPAHTSTELKESDATDMASFISGAGDMYAFLNPDRAECVFAWLGSRNDEQIVHALEDDPEKPAAEILAGLIERSCAAARTSGAQH